jgi:hypothetical protein
MQMILAPSVQAPPLPLLLNLLVRPLSQVQGLLLPPLAPVLHPTHQTVLGAPLPVAGPLKEAPAPVRHPSKVGQGLSKCLEVRTPLSLSSCKV